MSHHKRQIVQELLEIVNPLYEETQGHSQALQ
jgi:hypothetical protein